MPMRSHASRPVNITAAFAYSLRNAGQSLHGLLWVRVKRSSNLFSYGSCRIGISRHMRHEFGPPCDPSVNIRPLLWPRVHSGIWSFDVQGRTVAHIVVYPLCGGSHVFIACSRLRARLVRVYIGSGALMCPGLYVGSGAASLVARSLERYPWG